MTYLLLDLGNSTGKYRLYDKGRFTDAGQTPTDALHDIITSLNFSKRLAGINLVSVAADDLTRKMVDKLQASFQCPVQRIATSQSAFGVSCGYDEPDTLGDDRWVAMLAAYQKTVQQGLKKPVLVIDCGTVITADVINSDGQHLGGWLLPNTELLKSSLQQKSDRVSRAIQQSTTTKMEASVKVAPGCSTLACIEHGGRLASIGFIEKCIAQAKNITNAELLCFLTGGGAKELQPLLSNEIKYSPELIFDGLALFIE